MKAVAYCSKRTLQEVQDPGGLPRSKFPGAISDTMDANSKHTENITLCPSQNR